MLKKKDLTKKTSIDKKKPPKKKRIKAIKECYLMRNWMLRGIRC